MKKKILLFALAVGTLLCGVACNNNGGSSTSNKPIDETLQAWESNTEIDLELGTEYLVPNEVVADSTGKGFTPAYSVFNAYDEEIVLINGCFLANDVEGYTIKYTIVDGNNEYEKSVAVNVADTTAPEIFCSKFENGFRDSAYSFPQLFVIDNSNEDDIIPQLTLKHISNDAETVIECTEEGFTPTEMGQYTLTAVVADSTGNSSEWEWSFVIDRAYLVDTEASTSWITKKSGASLTIKNNDCTIHAPYVDEGLKGTYIYFPGEEDAEYRFSLNLGDLTGFDWIEMDLFFIPGGNLDHPMWASMGDYSTDKYIAWQSKYTLKVPVSEVDDFVVTQSWGSEICIRKVRGVIGERMSLSSYPANIKQGDVFTLPTATMHYAGELLESKTVDVSATFNGETVDITNGTYTPRMGGTLEVTYTCGEVTQTIAIEVIGEVMSLSSYPTRIRQGNAFTLPTATIQLAGDPVEGKIVDVSATFNGEEINVSSGSYTPTAVGNLTITYTCGALTKTITIEVIDEDVELSFVVPFEWYLVHGGAGSGTYENLGDGKIKLTSNGGHVALQFANPTDGRARTWDLLKAKAEECGYTKIILTIYEQSGDAVRTTYGLENETAMTLNWTGNDATPARYVHNLADFEDQRKLVAVYLSQGSVTFSVTLE